MSRTRRAPWVLLPVLPVAGLVAIGGAVSAKPSPPPRVFGIAGDVTGLYPGGQKTLRLTVTNPFASTLTVAWIDVTSVAVDRRHCPASSVRSPGYRHLVRIPRRGAVYVMVPVTMRSNASSACQGATFTLRYTGIGVQS